ncbi:hypothetical protein K466DRAFT_589975 [Polyporus arcularius HHB13444]|uniref:C3H1-type domain-containing protein n=1 Tax=Polyporus arcularius HHB13444 TaxID=1314778 RepID=A0A5C3P2R3_9APHY|nr:hypothetical protein K466DRAFT_589975 [Polyporus arcularius HHB13444]
MDTPSTSAAALKLEIERLRGAINRHQAGQPAPGGPVPTHPRNNVYVNPTYKPYVKTFKPPSSAATAPRPASRPPPTAPDEKRDVIIDGVAFESSGRSLVRKDLPKPPSKPPSMSALPSSRPAPFVRNKTGIMMNAARTYKPKTSRRGRAMNRNLTLDNTRKQYQSRRLNAKRKYSEKPCPRFTTTGSCNRGLTCMYQHDPSKIAICWPFLQGICPHTAETCALSHDPTPERTPLCVHFANNGRCNRPNCPFPHVHVGPREGICRDFAVLGYCEKGLDCDKQHVRECPDFAEKGQCTTRGCKLPHVIRANRNRKAPVSTSGPSADSSSGTTPSSARLEIAVETDGASSSRQITAEDGQLGDEFISLTFHESESEESEESEEEDVDEDVDLDGEEEDRESHLDADV